MKILIDIGHPGHVHLFRPFAKIMIGKGHDILFTCRQKEFEVELLRSEEFTYISFGKHFKSKSGKIWGLVKFNMQMLKTSLYFKPDIFLSHGSIYASHIAFILGKYKISMEDSGNMEQIRLYLPFTKAVLTPFELPENLGEKQIRYHAYHELAYLNPKYFTPSKEILCQAGIDINKPFVLLRFVNWTATHDLGQGGFSLEQKEELVAFFSQNYTLFISSEGKAPKHFEKHLIKIKPEHMHHVLAYADLVISEGATMASEAGVLGTPAIYVNSLKRCYNTDQEKYGTVFNFKNGDGVLDKAKEILEMQNRKEIFQERQQKMLSEKIDLTAFLVWFIENYPNSIKIMKENPDYQYNFK